MKEQAQFPNQFDPVLVHTGQHYDANMSDIFFRDLDIPMPDYFLEIGNGSQAEQTVATMERFDQLCEAHCFDQLLVVGDVTSHDSLRNYGGEASDSGRSRRGGVALHACSANPSPLLWPQFL
jgi:hypothetical protein